MGNEEKNKYIEEVIDILKEDGRILKYLSEEEIRKRLRENITDIEYGEMEDDNWEAMYDAASKKIVCRENTQEDKLVIIHEMLHGLTENEMYFGEKDIVNSSGTHFTYLDNVKVKYEIGRGLNEGITEYLARNIDGNRTHNNLLNALGIHFVNDESYPLEQAIVEELIAIYGEESVLTTYLNSSLKILVNEIGKSGAIKKPKNMLKNILLELDISEIMERTGFLLFDNKAFKEKFNEIQNKIISKIVIKELEYALKSKDVNRIARVKKIIENLQELNFTLDGKNIASEYVTRFNEKTKQINNIKRIEILPTENPSKEVNLTLKEFAMVSELNKENSIQNSIFKVFRKTFNKMAYMIQAIRNFNLLVGQRKIIPMLYKTPEEINSIIKNEKSDCDREKLLTQIRGMNEEEYKKSCDEREEEMKQPKINSNEKLISRGQDR